MRTSDLPKIIRRRKSLARAILALVAGIAAAIGSLAITSAPGPGLDPDSASYLGAAESLARGRGYRIAIANWSSPDSTAPLTHFPPGYSTAIAGPLSLGISPLQSARFVNALAALVDLSLVTGLAAFAAGEMAAAMLAVGIMLMPSFVDGHLPVLSEPLFLACWFATLATLSPAAGARSERERVGWCFASGCASSLAVMVRYVGISACGVSTLWSLLLPGTLRERLRRAAVATIPWLMFTALWVAHAHRTAAGTESIRRMGTYGGIGDAMRQAVATVVAWLVPISSDDTLPGRRWIALALAILLTVGVVLGGQRIVRLTTDDDAGRRGLRNLGRTRPGVVVLAALLLAAAYVAVLLASRLFADPDIPFDNRLLLPFLMLAMLVVAITIRAWWGGAHVASRILAAALLVAWIGASYRVSSDDVDWTSENGYDLTGEPWRSSAIMAWARDNAARRPLYSNWPTAVVLQLGWPSHETPADSDSLVLRRFAEVVSARHGIVLAFDIAAPHAIGVQALLSTPGLERIAKLPDGSIFVAIPR